MNIVATHLVEAFGKLNEKHTNNDHIAGIKFAESERVFSLIYLQENSNG